MLFTAKLKEDTILKTVLTTLSQVSTQALFDFSADGLVLKAYDEIFSCMIHVNLKEQFFAEFNAPQENIQAKIDLDNLKKILSVAKKDDDITLTMDTDESQLTVQMKPKDGKKTEREFSLTSLIIESDEEEEIGEDPYSIDIYTLGLISTVEFSENALNELVPQVSLFAEEIKIDFSDDMITFSSDSGTGQQTRIEVIPGENEYITSIELSDAAFSTMFKVSNLDNLTKMDRISSSTALKIDPGKPGLFIFEINDPDNIDDIICKMGVMVAPVLEEESEEYDQEIDEDI